MASIVKRVKKGRPYYCAVQSQRAHGKPRITWQKYLGTIDAIIERADAARPPRPKETVIFEAGGVAALLRIAQRLGLAQLIDTVAPKRRQGPTVGQYTLLAALNRALAPRSKVEIGPWYEGTVLRQIGLALLVADPFRIPLFHQTYPGDVPDVSLFPQLGRDLLARYRKATGQKDTQATLVFDKGNVSDDAMETLVVERTPFVAALAASRCPQLLATPLEQPAVLPELAGCRAASAAETFRGADCRAVVVYTESFFTQQLAGVTHNLVSCQKKLRDQVLTLDKWRAGKGRGKKPTAAGVRKSVQRILAPQFMKDLIPVQIEPDPDTGIPRLTYRVDHAALQRLTDQRLGRSVLVAHRLDADPATIVRTYRHLTAIEDTFSALRHPHFAGAPPGLGRSGFSLDWQAVLR